MYIIRRLYFYSLLCQAKKDKEKIIKFHYLCRFFKIMQYECVYPFCPGF